MDEHALTPAATAWPGFGQEEASGQPRAKWPLGLAVALIVLLNAALWGGLFALYLALF